MRTRIFRVTPVLVAALILVQGFPSFGPRAASGQSLGSDGVLGDLLLSGRMEIIHLHNFTGPIREGIKEKSRFYFNNIFLNLEGSLGEKADFIIEYQPLTADLYLLGGFLTIAESLEGIGTEEPTVGARENGVARIATLLR